MTNELLKEMTDKLIYGDKSVAPYGILNESLHNTPLSWGTSGYSQVLPLASQGEAITTFACSCGIEHLSGLCNCMIPVFENDEVIEQCDLGDTTCEACN